MRFPPAQALLTLLGAAAAHAQPAFVPPDLIEPVDGGRVEASILVRPQAKEELPAPPPEASDPAAELLASLRLTHPWASFEPGAWRRVRVVSETFGADGAFTGRSVAERTERLLSVDRVSYQIETEQSVDIGGRRTPGPRETQGYWIVTDRPVSFGRPEVERGDAASISLGGAMVSCHTWGVLQPTPGGVEAATVYESPDSTPRLLRRERRSVINDEPSTSVVTSVTRTAAPVRYGEFLAAAWHESVEVTQPDGERTEEFLVRSTEAPGGVVRRSLVEFDPQGTRRRWAVTELVASGRTPREEIESVPAASPDPEPELGTRPRRLRRLLRRELLGPEETEAPATNPL